jgi:hypothetical protein
VEENLKEIWPIRAMGEAEIEIARSKWDWVPKTALLGGQQWCVGRSQASSPLTLVHLHIRHYWPLSRNSESLNSCPGLYGDSRTHNYGNILFFPPTSASTRTRFSHPEEGSSKLHRNVETYPYDKSRIQQKLIKWFIRANLLVAVFESSCVSVTRTSGIRDSHSTVRKARLYLRTEMVIF